MITFFFRKKNLIMHSIEELFHAVAAKIPLSKREEDMPCETQSLIKMFKNVYYVYRNQSEINHVTGDIHYVVLGLSKKNFNILTIHDCVLLENTPRTNPKFWLYKWLWYDLPISRANLITVISEKTKQEVIKYTNCPESKLIVIPNFVKPTFTYQAKDFNTHNPILLQIGTGENKNLSRVIKAIQGISCQLNIVGLLSEQQIKELNSNKIKFINYFNLTHTEIIDQYSQSDLVIFASTYEGFGMPIIEGQAVGRPVITSNLEPMIWVSNESTCLVNPFDSDAIKNGILKIIEDKYFREDLIKKGLMNVERFNLSAVTDAYMRIYQESNNA